MITFRFERAPRLITCLGAHSDDIEIGAGGALLHWAAAYPETRFRFIVLTGNQQRMAEANRSAEALLGERVEVVVGGFEENLFSYRDPAGVKGFIHERSLADETDMVLAPRRGDLHQDHRFVAEVALQAFRDHPILGYEVPKYDGDFGSPGVYVALTADEAVAKLDHLGREFASQHDKPWYSRELFSAVLRIRGMESRSASGFAEAFWLGKAVLS